MWQFPLFRCEGSTCFRVYTMVSKISSLVCNVCLDSWWFYHIGLVTSGIQTSLINILSLWSFVFGILLEQMNNRIILNSSLQVSYVISPLPFHELCKIHSPLINEKARCTGTWILPWISPWTSANIHCFILTK